MKHRAGTRVAPFFLTLVARVAFASPKNWTPAEDQIARLESGIHLEALRGWDASGSASLAGYERFYTGYQQKGSKVILGELVLPTQPGQHAGVHLVASRDEFPAISGGGCTVINLVYSVAKRAITSIHCNGSI